MTQPNTATNRRRFSRILLDATIQFEHENQIWSSQLIDISLKGALIILPAGWNGQKGDIYTLDVHLDEETSIGMNALVAHIDEKSIGFECTVIDISSIAHLRRIVELNLGDTHLLERELLALIETKSETP